MFSFQLGGVTKRPRSWAPGGTGLTVQKRALHATMGIVSSFLAGCHAGVLDPQGPIARAEWLILLDSTAIMLAVVIPVIAMTLGFAWWFRASNSKARHLPDWSYSGQLELIVWAIPGLLVLFLGGVAWVSSHDLDPQKPLDSKAKPLTVEVVSMDWKWLFIYPEQGLADVNELVVPAGIPLEFHLTSATVMNSFFVPQLGSQIYTMWGMVTRLNLLADLPGTYPGFSAQFSGDGFSGMHFDVKAVSPEAFSTWVHRSQEQGPDMDAPAYTELAKASSDVPAKLYRHVDSGLFDRIVAGSGDTSGRPIHAPSDTANHSEN